MFCAVYSLAREHAIDDGRVPQAQQPRRGRSLSDSLAPSPLEREMTSFRIPDLTPEQIDQVVRDMDEQGYARVANFFDEDTIAAARRYVVEELDKHSGEYFSYIGRDAVRGSLLADLGGSARLCNIFSRIYQRGTGKAPPDSGTFQVLRVLSGRTGLEQSYRFRYDAYVVTALVPIAIPSDAGAKRGDLIIYPKLRAIRSNVVFNVLEKILLQNPVARRIARSDFMRRLLKAKVLRMSPGDIYFFWGYQSLHGNEPCDASSVRATGLFHFADPHENSFLVTAIQGLRRRHERRIRERAMARSAHLTS